MNKKMVTEDIDIEYDIKVDDLIEILNKYKWKDATFNVDTYCDYGCPTVEFSISFEREESD